MMLMSLKRVPPRSLCAFSISGIISSFIFLLIFIVSSPLRYCTATSFTFFFKSKSSFSNDILLLNSRQNFKTYPCL